MLTQSKIIVYWDKISTTMNIRFSIKQLIPAMILLCCMLHAATVAAEKDYAIALIPAALLEDANDVIRSEEMQFDVRAPGQATLRYQLVVSIFNDKSHYFSFPVFYNKSKKVNDLEAAIFDAAGNLVRKIKKEEIRDISTISDFSIYEDNRTKLIEFPETGFPYTVRIAYELDFDDIQTYPAWHIQQYGTAVENAAFTIKMPADISLYYKAENTRIQPSVSFESGKKVYRWSVNSLKAFLQEENAPAQKEIFPAIFVSPQDFETNGYHGSMTTWKDFGKFIYELNRGREKLSPTMVVAVHNITASCQSTADKIQSLYRYLQEHMRYVSVQLGIGGWQTYDANYVESNQYGDCKALTYFMKGMLMEAGIKAYPVLIDADDEDYYEPKEEFVYPGFNHVILYIPQEKCWLECTSSSFPANYLGEDNAGKKALLITENGGEIIATPPRNPSDNRQQNAINIELNEDGSARFFWHLEATGSLQETYRYLHTQLSKEDQLKLYQRNISLPNHLNTAWELEVDKDQPHCRLTYGADIPKFASKAGTRLFVPLNAYDTYDNVPPVAEKRHQPVVRENGYIESDSVVIALPEGYTVESIPKAVIDLDTEMGSYHVTIVPAPGQLIYRRQLSIKPFRLPAERYPEWRDFCRQLAQFDSMKVVLKK